MPVATLRLNIRAIGSADAASRLSDAVGGVAGALGRAVERVGSALRRASTLGLAVALIAAPLFTLAKVTLASAGGLAALAVVVGGAAAPFVALAVTAALNADKMGAAGRQFSGAAGRVADAWMELARRTAPQTLGPITDVLNGIAAAIPKLEPLIREIAPEFARIGRDIRGWLEGSGFERFLRVLNDFGVPAFRNLANAGRDVMATVGIGFREFLPMAREMEETLASGAARLRRWAQGGGFSRFLESARRDMPAVNRFLREASETIRIIGGLLNDLGPGQLGALSTMLDLFNRIDPSDLKDIVLGFAALVASKELIDFLAALALFRAGQLEVLGGAALSAAAASLAASASGLFGMAASIEGIAADVARRSASVNSDALDRIRDIWSDIEGGATATFSAPSVGVATVVRMGVGSTWAAVQSNFANTALFSARIEAGLFAGVMAAVLAAWVVVRAASIVPAVFRAMAIPGNVPGVAAILTSTWLRVRAAAAAPAVFRAIAVSTVAAVAASILATWAGVRAAAAVPAVFRAMAIPGNVPGVAALLISLWATVRAMAAVPVIFRATATPGNVPSVASQIVAAWARVRAAAGAVPNFTATANPGNVVSAASQAVSAWQRLSGMTRTWSGMAQVQASAAIVGSSAVVNAWHQVLGMARSWSATASIVIGSWDVRIPQGGSGFAIGEIPWVAIGSPFSGIGGLFDPNAGAIPGAPAILGGGADLGPGGGGQDPGDFAGGFAEGGPVGNSSGAAVNVPSRRRGMRQVHIYEDIWIKDREDLVGVLQEALGG